MKAMGFKRIYTVLKLFAKSSSLILFASRADFLILFFGKLIALSFGVIWINSIYDKVPSINGYSYEQMLVFTGFFLTLDRLIQILFYRSLWFVQVYVQNGSFDKLLTYPIRSLMIATFKMIDVNDTLMLIPSSIVLIYALIKIQIFLSSIGIILLPFLLLISLSIAYSILLVIASLSFYVTKVENFYLLYRDIANVSRFPPEIFGSVFSFIFLFIIPIFAIFTIPSKFILGMLSYSQLGIISLVAIGLLIGSIKFWNFSIKKYTSAGG